MKVEFLINKLKSKGTEEYFGVPDSLLKEFCNYLEVKEHLNNHIVANEGTAIGMATGYHLGSGKVPCIYMQNSGIGNAINPLISLADVDVYKIPMIIFIGWRGQPGVKDEPQHVKQGKIMENLIKSLEIPYSIFDQNNFENQIDEAYDKIEKTSQPYIFLITKGTFEADNSIKLKKESRYTLMREEVIESILNKSNDSVIISTTGKTSRELYELREKRKETHDLDFLTVGSMGHTISIAMGVSLANNRDKVICIDGDGSALMHMGSLSYISKIKSNNILHIVINNGSHESVGGFPTLAQNIELLKIAESCGYNYVNSVGDMDSLGRELDKIMQMDGTCFLEVFTKQGSRSDLGRPKEKPSENKEKFIKNFTNMKEI